MDTKITPFQDFTGSEFSKEIIDGKLGVDAKKKISKPLPPLELHFRPIYNKLQHRDWGYFTELRINDRRIGVILPETYLPLIQKTPVALNLGKWQLDETFAAVTRLHKRHIDFEWVSIYITLKHFLQKNFVELVSKKLEKFDINPQEICFEISDYLLIEKNQIVRENMKKIRELGIRLILIDFGSEFSAISRLSDVQVDIVRLDKDLVAGVAKSQRSADIAESIITLAKRLGMEVIADGINYREQVDRMSEMGINLFSGLYYGESMLEKQIKTRE